MPTAAPATSAVVYCCPLLATVVAVAVTITVCVWPPVLVLALVDAAARDRVVVGDISNADTDWPATSTSRRMILVPPNMVHAPVLLVSHIVVSMPHTKSGLKALQGEIGMPPDAFPVRPLS